MDVSWNSIYCKNFFLNWVQITASGQSKYVLYYWFHNPNVNGKSKYNKKKGNAHSTFGFHMLAMSSISSTQFSTRYTLFFYQSKTNVLEKKRRRKEKLWSHWIKLLYNNQNGCNANVKNDFYKIKKFNNLSSSRCGYVYILYVWFDEYG